MNLNFIKETNNFKKKINFSFLFIIVCFTSCSNNDKNSHKKMIDILSQKEVDIDPETNFYANKQRLSWLQKEDNYKNISQKFQHQAIIANEMLNAGFTKQAAELFNELLFQIDSLKIFPPKDFIIGIKDMLAITYLRMGEETNCIDGHNSESCIIPLRNNGIHRNKFGAQNAIKIYKELLTEDPSDYVYRWLLNIAYMAKGEYPEKVPNKWLISQLIPSDTIQFPEFKEIASKLNIDQIGLAGGSILEDFDNDHDLDLIVSSWGASDQIHYFENIGKGNFQKKTQESNLKGITGGLNMVHADYNNDNYPDIFVLRGGWFGDSGNIPNSLLKNNGDGTFTDVTIIANIFSQYPTQTASWGDYNNDGWIDLFIGNESSNKSMNQSELYHNNGDGTFTEISKNLGLNISGFIKGAVWGDINNDGNLDLYISRLGQINLLFVNEGKEKSWKFKERSANAGVQEPINSFPAWFFDFNNDGWQDIWVSGYDNSSGHVAKDYLGIEHKGESPRLYQNNQDGTFTDVTSLSNLNHPLLSMGSNYGDLNNDGFLDFYVGTGDPDYRSLQPNRMFLNINGKFFQDVTFHGRFGHIQKGHGVSFGDIDEDGDQDIHAVMGGAYQGSIYQNALFNNPGNWDSEWIGVKLKGNTSNKLGIGARISVETTDGQKIYRTISSGGSFGGNPFREFIGLGKNKNVSKIIIEWPSGNTQTESGLSTGKWHIIKEIKN